MSSRVRGALLGAVFLVLTTAILLEIALRVADALEIVTPAERLTEPVSFYRDESPAFGVWHPPNAEYTARADCFEVVYHSNSHGARDRERNERSEAPRVVVLGDSFVEGIGMLPEQRMTDRLEASTGIGHLNFGTAGNFGSIQEWLLYTSLASRFDHDAVLLFTFPNNDFLDNDPERFWQKGRYRPYLRETPAGYEVTYPISLDEAKRHAERQLWWNRWHNAIYLYRLVAFLDSQIRVRLAQGETTEFGYVGYVQFTEEDLERLFYTYRQIRDAADGRELAIFTIPRLTDLYYQEAEGYPEALPKRIAAFAAAEERIRYTDLMPAFVDHASANAHAFGDYFIPCDGHWSELGNRVAAETVERTLGDLYGSLAADR